MNAFERLHPAIQHHIVNSLGWQTLRPLQEKAVDPILGRQNALLLAPTAGGKTEAAIFPLLSGLLEGNWRPISILYICPIKALLNNIEIRLRQYSDWLGRRVGIWHGDIGQAQRNQILKEPPDILLATPESLEVMLVSQRTDETRLFANVQAVVVDEIHAFAGDDRGWHLLAVLDRISCLSRHEIQRVGLSATVGNPDDLLNWLKGASGGPGTIISPKAETAPKSDIEVDYVGGLDNAAIVISRLHRGEKRLVFCDSRSQVEALSGELRRLGVQTFVSHSSLSADERRRAEAAFAEARNCVIAATSTLELGIDVGDLDRVIQIDAPSTVASFLQRLGRTGRRPGTVRNCLFLATTEDSFLRTLGLLDLWSNGYVEPVTPPQKPYHILAQQVMALSLQGPGVGLHTWTEWLQGVFHSAMLSIEESRQLVRHMLQTGYLFEDQGILSVGRAAERTFGHRNYMSLLSVFDAPPLFTVFHGRVELGTVHELTFQVKSDEPVSLSLGGHFWRVKYVDWNRRKAFVEPGAESGKSRWFSAGQPLSFAFCQAVLRVLVGSVPPVSLSKRAREKRDAILSEYEWVESEQTAIVSDGRGTSWWTFAGGILNAAIAADLEVRLGKLRYDNFALHFKDRVNRDQVIASISELRGTIKTDIGPVISDEVRDGYKFGECVPGHLLEKMIGIRFDCSENWRDLKKADLKTVREYSE